MVCDVQRTQHLLRLQSITVYAAEHIQTSEITSLRSGGPEPHSYGSLGLAAGQ